MTLILAMILAFLPAPVERCAVETGETQYVCMWADGTGSPVLNLDYGRAWIRIGD